MLDRKGLDPLRVIDGHRIKNSEYVWYIKSKYPEMLCFSQSKELQNIAPEKAINVQYSPNAEGGALDQLMNCNIIEKEVPKGITV